ncbi:S8 family serine peptidase [uncultured Croceitalea sp.]|uniref:S8 family serine peptidase n=1 Tax=uncultured Croceitalea sp. TaxID=1798908 RepID=UPI0033067F65
MDCKKPIRGTGFFPSFIFFIITITTAFAQTQEQRFQIQKKFDNTGLLSLITDFEKEEIQKMKMISAKLMGKQWQSTQKQKDGTVVSLNDIGDDGTLLFYTTQASPTSKVSRAEALYKGGTLDLDITGYGMQVGVWDAGAALTTHQEFDGRVFNTDGTDAIDSHGTMVTGTIVASGIKQKAQGIAYEAQALTHDWRRDKIEVAEAAASGLLLSNHSYGIKSDRLPDWYFGGYIKVSQDWDKIMYNAPYYLMVTAAGNAQKSRDNEVPSFGKAADGFDLLTGFATSKNGLVIAGAETKLNNKGELKSAKVTGYSSFGPIDDSRIKPDLAGDGALIESTTAVSNTSYKTAMGTSMAAPGVTGSLLLLQQYHNELYGSFMKAATLKGLTLHTADDVQEKGPDYKMGWGVINTKKAAKTITYRDYTAILTEESLANGNSSTYSVTANGNGPLQVSISWTDPEGEYINRGDLNAITPALINDLDVRVVKNGETYFPWKLTASQADAAAKTGDNQVDPFERIDIENASGEYEIIISHKGNLKNSVQDFTLIVTGVSLSECQLSAPESLELVSAADDALTFDWSATDDTLYEFQYKKENAEEWIVETTLDNFIDLSELEIGKKYTVRLRSVCSLNLMSAFTDELQFVFNGSDTEVEMYQTFSFSDELEIQVFPNPATEKISIAANVSNDAVYAITSTSGLTVAKGKVSETINVSDLATGLYIMTVLDLSGVKSTKFFKN